MADTTYGPALPPYLANRANLEEPEGHSENIYSNKSLDIIGPVPDQCASNKVEMQLEERALKIKLDKYQSTSNCENKSKPREEWMLELPQINTLGLGLVNRKFRTKGGPDLSNRSSWTKTPQDKEEIQTKSETRQKKVLKLLAKKKDTEQHILSKKYKNDRGDSLLVLHCRKLKAKKEKETKKVERRYFNREIDLQTNRFDQSRTNSVIKKAQLLDTRFSSGKSKYL